MVLLNEFVPSFPHKRQRSFTKFTILDALEGCGHLISQIVFGDQLRQCLLVCFVLPPPVPKGNLGIRVGKALHGLVVYLHLRAGLLTPEFVLSGLASCFAREEWHSACRIRKVDRIGIGVEVAMQADRRSE